MQKISSPLVILHYDQLFHLNLIRCMNGTRSNIVMSVAYLTHLFIHHYYNVMIVIWNISNIKFKIHKTEGLMKWLIAYLRHIKLYDAAWASYLCNRIWHDHGYTVFISTIPTCFIVVPIAHVLIFHTNNHIGIITTHIFQYVFIFIA